MDDSTGPPTADRLTALVEAHEYDAARSALETLADCGADARKTRLRGLRAMAEERPQAVGPLCETLEPFLADDERTVRLVTAKLFVAVAATEPNDVVTAVDTLGERLEDEDEFYYVRARCAEALGYVALEHPEPVATPDTVATLRIGLEFDDAEVRTKLAKALAAVALGDPTRLSHRIPMLTDRLEDEQELVRYHLTTALAAIACDRPEALRDGCDALASRLVDDENDYVRGRAAEALGLVARAESASADGIADSARVKSALTELEDAAESFVAERARYALASIEDENGRTAGDLFDGIGTLESIARRTDEIADAITSADGAACPNCGCSLPAAGPPTCPQCGAPW